MNRCSILRLAALAAVAVVCCSDTAYAQPQLVVTPAAATNQSTPLTFSAPSGGVSTTQGVGVTTASGAGTTVNIQSSASWLVVSPGGSVNIPISLNVRCNTQGLANGSYSGSFTITVSGTTNDSVTVYVSLTVTGSSLLTSNPPNLTFTALAGASQGSPASTSVQISSNGSILTYTLQAQTTDGHNWLLLSTTQGTTNGNPFTVSVNPASLAPNTYTGFIIASSTSTSDTVQISVSLTVNGTTSVSVSPTSPPPFLYQQGTSSAVPPSQQLSVTSIGGSVGFTIQASPAAPWLVLSAFSGTASSTPAIITLSVNPNGQGLSVGTYSTNLTITPSGQAALAPVPITLIVAGHPLLQVSGNTLSGNTLTFTAPFGGSVPAAQAINVTDSTVTGFTVSSNQSWLSASPSSGTTPGAVNVQANPSGLSLGTYSGTLTIAPTNGDSYTETVNVNFTVTSSAQIMAGPSQLLFSYEIGKSVPLAQTIQLVSSVQSLQFTDTVSTSTCGSNWLQALPGSTFTNTTLTVTVIVTGITSPTTCSGTISISYVSGTGQQTLQIPVTMAVSSGAELSIGTQQGFGIFNGAIGSSPIYSPISLTSTDFANQVDFQASVSGGPWIGLLGTTNGLTPQNLTLQIIPNAVSSAGVYQGMLTVTSTSLAVQYSSPITLTVTSNTTVSVSPSALSFTETQSGSTPAAQTLTLTSSSTTAPATYTAAISSITGGVNWLQISPSSGTANGNLQVSILPNTLSQGDYQATITFTFGGAATTSATTNVTLHVTAQQTVTVTPPSLSFSYQAGSATPSTQQLTISSTGGSVNVTVSATSSGWLAVSPTTGATPLTVNISVNPQGLSPQSQAYTGSISIASAGVLTTALSVPVSFTVTAAPAPQPIIIINNATGSAGVIAPGEEIAIKGNGLGPASPANGTLFSVNSSGGVSNTLAGVQVTFDSIPGTPIFVSAGQINVMVPYEINGRLSTTMVVTFNGAASAPFQLAVAAAAPGLFTNNFTGQGQVAAINQNGSANGSSGSGATPVPRGQVISLYGTGGGQTSPFSVTGSVTPIPTSASQLLNLPSNTTATIGGFPAIVTFAGEAPGLVTGVFQINVIVPSGVTPGNAVPVTVTIDGITSPVGTTIAVQ